ncbi:MAG TPA: DJ-1/PfpI family protein [Magnetospirillum sp.]|jgi:protease I|nr:DJ-1/PfpI family protein [Magnetospirillum sp.]
MARVAVAVASGFEQSEMTMICRTLAESGHRAVVVSPKKHSVRAWDNTHWGGDLPVDVPAIDAEAQDFAAIVLPGGVLSADTLRADEAIVRLVRDAAVQGKPVAALGHAVWVLVEAGLARGRAMTGAPSVESDLINAGANWSDLPAVEDGKVITGHHGHDTAAFMDLVRGRLS